MFTTTAYSVINLYDTFPPLDELFGISKRGNFNYEGRICIEPEIRYIFGRKTLCFYSRNWRDCANWVKAVCEEIYVPEYIEYNTEGYVVGIKKVEYKDLRFFNINLFRQENMMPENEPEITEVEYTSSRPIQPFSLSGKFIIFPSSANSSLEKTTESVADDVEKIDLFEEKIFLGRFSPF